MINTLNSPKKRKNESLSLLKLSREASSSEKIPWENPKLCCKSSIATNRSMDKSTTTKEKNG